MILVYENFQAFEDELRLKATESPATHELSFTYSQLKVLQYFSALLLAYLVNLTLFFTLTWFLVGVFGFACLAEFSCWEYENKTEN